MKGFLARITPPCREVTRLASESMDRALPLPSRIKLQLHYWICRGCDQYRRQLWALRQITRKSASEVYPAQDAQFFSVTRSRIKEAFRHKRT